MLFGRVKYLWRWSKTYEIYLRLPPEKFPPKSTRPHSLLAWMWLMRAMPSFIQAVPYSKLNPT